jgi:hypothetical protein
MNIWLQRCLPGEEVARHLVRARKDLVPETLHSVRQSVNKSSSAMRGTRKSPSERSFHKWIKLGYILYYVKKTHFM